MLKSSPFPAWRCFPLLRSISISFAFAILSALPVLANERVLMDESFDYGPPEAFGFYSKVLFGSPETSDLDDSQTRWQWLNAAGGRLENSTRYGRNTRLLASFEPVTLQREGDYIEVSFDFHFMDVTGATGAGFVAALLDLPDPVDDHFLVTKGETHPIGGSEGYAFQQQADSTNASLGFWRFDPDGFSFRLQDSTRTEYVQSITGGNSAVDAVSFRLRLTRTADGVEFTGLHGGDELNPFVRNFDRTDSVTLNALYFSAQAIAGRGGALDNVRVVTNAQ